MEKRSILTSKFFVLTSFYAFFALLLNFPALAKAQEKRGRKPRKKV